MMYLHLGAKAVPLLMREIQDKKLTELEWDAVLSKGTMLEKGRGQQRQSQSKQPCYGRTLQFFQM